MTAKFELLKLSQPCQRRLIAASSNTVNLTSMEQITSVEVLNGAAGKLNQNADMLVLEVKKFRVE
jgi:hypothetical protein